MLDISALSTMDKIQLVRRLSAINFLRTDEHVNVASCNSPGVSTRERLESKISKNADEVRKFVYGDLPSQE